MVCCATSSVLVCRGITLLELCVSKHRVKLCIVCCLRVCYSSPYYVSALAFLCVPRELVLCLACRPVGVSAMLCCLAATPVGTLARRLLFSALPAAMRGHRGRVISWAPGTTLHAYRPPPAAIRVCRHRSPACAAREQASSAPPPLPPPRHCTGPLRLIHWPSSASARGRAR